MAFKSDRQRKAMFARIKSHVYSNGKRFKVDLTEKYARVRLKSPELFKKNTFRTQKLGEFTRRIAAKRKRTGEWETQAVLIKKSEFFKKTPSVRRTIKRLKYL